jgi:hypothetical protein
MDETLSTMNEAHPMKSQATIFNGNGSLNGLSLISVSWQGGCTVASIAKEKRDG